MLQVYKNLFERLNESSISYCIYKGLNHLTDDLQGIRGDLDLLIKDDSINEFKSIVKDLGFVVVKKSSETPCYYLNRDLETGRLVMLDVDIKFRFGDNSIKTASYLPDFANLSMDIICIDGTDIQVLGKKDYFPLMLLMRVTSEKPSESSWLEAQALRKSNTRGVLDSEVGKLVQLLDPALLSLEKVSSWAELQDKYKVKTLNFLGGGFLKYNANLVIKSSYFYLKETKRKLLRLLGQPPALSHQGRLVAFVGVDGAGKSSAIDSVCDDQYFKATGIKRIYFGGNEFITFRILELYKYLVNSPKLSKLRIVPAIIMNIERRLRLLKALYYKSMGNLVLCDRYYYDDELVRDTIKSDSTNSGLIKTIQLSLLPKVRIKPDITFFLDVSPEVAYQRKQDFCFDTMLKVNANYRNLMMKQEGITFINADQEQHKVLLDIFSKLKKLEEVN